MFPSFPVTPKLLQNHPEHEMQRKLEHRNFGGILAGSGPGASSHFWELGGEQTEFFTAGILRLKAEMSENAQEQGSPNPNQSELRSW